MNHFISAICWSLLSVDGWNSLSIHFLASASPAQALWPRAKAAAAKATGVKRIFIGVSSWHFPVMAGDIRLGRNGRLAFKTSLCGQPRRITSASRSIEATNPNQIEGSCSRPNHSIMRSLTATKARFR